jgi:molybdenum cofactor biosynthesis enzyme MoaA
MIKPDVRYVPQDRMSNIEFHVAHGCNLTCESCSHYSNHNHTGILTVEESQEQMIPWSKRIKPKWFSLMGGEPTLNKNLVEIVELSAKIWRDTKIRVITNGSFYTGFQSCQFLI